MFIQYAGNCSRPLAALPDNPSPGDRNLTDRIRRGACGAMRQALSCWIMAAAWLIAFRPTPGDDGAVTLRVMSFNIRYGTADDGENHWNQRK